MYLRPWSNCMWLFTDNGYLGHSFVVLLNDANCLPNLTDKTRLFKQFQGLGVLSPPFEVIAFQVWKGDADICVSRYLRVGAKLILNVEHFLIFTIIEIVFHYNDRSQEPISKLMVFFVKFLNF